MSEAVELPVDDLPIDHPSIGGILKEIDVPNAIEIQRKAIGRAGLCYWNVEEAVAKVGGARVDGWMLEWIPGLYMQAMHHSVWQSPRGQLVDVTATQSVRRNDHSTTTFAKDARFNIDLSFPVEIENRHFLLVDDDDVRKSLDWYRMNNRVSVLRCGALKADGRYTWTVGIGFRGPPFPADDAFLRDLGESYSIMHRYRAVVRDRYFPRPEVSSEIHGGHSPLWSPD